MKHVLSLLDSTNYTNKDPPFSNITIPCCGHRHAVLTNSVLIHLIITQSSSGFCISFKMKSCVSGTMYRPSVIQSIE
jgi:hypothetical protein